jgi:hypothetical protein
LAHAPLPPVLQTLPSSTALEGSYTPKTHADLVPRKHKERPSKEYSHYNSLRSMRGNGHCLKNVAAVINPPNTTATNAALLNRGYEARKGAPVPSEPTPTFSVLIISIGSVYNPSHGIFQRLARRLKLLNICQKVKPSH